MLAAMLITVIGSAAMAQTLTLHDIVNPSTVIMNGNKPVTFALHGFIEFNSLAEALRYIDSQSNRWLSGSLSNAQRHAWAQKLLNHAVESRLVSMTDERPLEVLLTHTEEELQQALAQVKEPVPSGYTEAFLQARRKWKGSLNCWSASPVMAARVLSNWYPIEEGIDLYGATYDSTEHFWQAVKYHPDVTIGQLNELLETLQRTDWSTWLANLENDPDVYLANAYAVEFLRHNLTRERLLWLRDELARQGLPADAHARQVQQRSAHSPRFTAYEEKVLWGDLADLLHLIYHFSPPQNAVRDELARRHFDGVYLGERKMKMGFVSEEFRSQMLEIWKVKYLEMPRFRELISSIPIEIRLEHFLNDGDSPDIPIPIYVDYLNQIRRMAMKSN
jgi:hypothetical protein